MKKVVLAVIAAVFVSSFVTTRVVQRLYASGVAAQDAPQQPRPRDPRSRSNRDCRDNVYNCVDTANPLQTPDTVWLEELTWMDVRDALKAGKTTVLIPTGGVEPNGPWLALGKHNYVLQVTCDAIARKLGNALCAPIVKLVPEGSIDPPRGMMDTSGTLSAREETFEAILTDMASSLKVHGFENIIFIGDSGGNQRGQQAVAQKLNAQWNGKPVVAHIPEYYDNAAIQKYLVQIGVTKANQPSDNVHDEPMYTFPMMVVDPATVRWAQRVKTGKATIDGVSIADKNKSLEIGRKIIDFHATNTVAAIKKAIANKGRADTRPSPQPMDAPGTFSIIGFDPETGEVGAAVQSRVFSVGSRNIWADASAGVAVTQATGDTSYGPQALALLRAGVPPAAIIKRILDDDPDPFPVEWSKQGRQFAVMNLKGEYAAHTGPKSTEWAGHKGGKFCTAQGNILASPAVVENMVAAFEKTQGHLTRRFLAALEAGQAAGGDKRGQQSAAMFIVKKNGGPFLHNDTVIRVQVDDNPEPIKELGRLVAIWEKTPRRPPTK